MENLDDFEFKLYSFKDENGVREIAAINEAYFFWKSFWANELANIGSDFPRWPDEFYRHDCLSVLTRQGIPVSLHLQAVQNLNLKACAEQSYFDKFTQTFTKDILADGYERVVSAGWLTVNSSFAKNKEKIVFSRCMLALTLKITEMLGCQALVAPTRNDNGMASKVFQWGAKSYGQKTTHNVLCEMVVMDHTSPIPLSEKEAALVEHAWKSIFPANKKSNRKKAA